MTDRAGDETFQIRDRRRWSEAAAEGPPEERGPRSTHEPPPQSPPRPPGGPAERSLAGLFMLLASLALAALEGVPDPAGGQPKRDLEQTAELIELLILLRERTEGRRTEEESRVLGDVIYDLQLRYVAATTRSG